MSTKNKRRKGNSGYTVIMAALLVATAAALLALVFVLVTDTPAANTSDTSSTSSASNEPSQSVSSEAISDEESAESSADESSAEVSEPPEDYETRVGKKYQIDITEYLQYIDPEDPNEYLMLVNLDNPLKLDYVPENLVDTEYTRQDWRPAQQLVFTAAKALDAFMREGALNGVTDVTVTSAYRSASYQQYLFNLYTEQEMTANPSLTREQAEAIVLTYSMRPGCSGHQTGLTCDMHNRPATDQSFASTPEAKWMAENCFRFGFILRYAEDKQDITGVEYEPWHFRFVGRKAATEMHELNMCLEEYVEYLTAQGRYDSRFESIHQ